MSAPAHRLRFKTCMTVAVALFFFAAIPLLRADARSGRAAGSTPPQATSQRKAEDQPEKMPKTTKPDVKPIATDSAPTESAPPVPVVASVPFDEPATGHSALSTMAQQEASLTEAVTEAGRRVWIVGALSLLQFLVLLAVAVKLKSDFKRLASSSSEAFRRAADLDAAFKALQPKFDRALASGSNQAPSNDNKALLKLSEDIRVLSLRVAELIPPQQPPITPPFIDDNLMVRDRGKRWIPSAVPQLLRDASERGQLLSVKARRIGGLWLLSDDDGEFFVDTTAPAAGAPVIIPKLPYFNTRHDFAQYKDFYDCESPGSGEVWIVEPATVDRTAEGWQLRRSGRLEVR